MSTAVMPCPTDDVLGAHVKRALAEHEAAVVTSHLDSCDSCRQIVLAVVRGGVMSKPTELAIGTPTDPKVAPTLPVVAGRSLFVTGERIGRYEIRRPLGAGGMGQVFAAYDGELDREVALKLMRPELVGAGGLAERLVRESRMMAKLAHPSVMTVYDVGRAGDSVFIAMELIRGETLGAYVRRVKPAWREIVALLERAGQGLAAAHDASIVHRDFKPDNVLVEVVDASVKRVVVTDFGVARNAAQPFALGTGNDLALVVSDALAVELTATGMTVGTPAYMAPEQLSGAGIDERADVFAFAVSAWELLFGERPFAGNSVAEIRAAMREPPVPPRGHAVPARVVAALKHGLAVRPDERHRDMHVFVRALAATRGSDKRLRALGIAGVGFALVGAGLVGAGALSDAPAVDPCLRTAESLESAYSPPRQAMARAALAADPARLGKLERWVNVWRETHATTCTAETDPAQAPAVTACLDARRTEIAGVVDDAILDGARAASLVELVSDPATCASPAPGLIAARVPSDPALRRQVSALRYRAFAAESARDGGKYTGALEEARAITAAAKQLWAPFYAESLYLLGTTEAQGGDATKGLDALREAAAVAERAHHDYIAANAWIQIVQSTAFDTGDGKRALEYAQFAESALERIGHKPNVAVMFHYAKGGALSQLYRNADAAIEFRKALAIAEEHAPELLPIVIQGLGYVLENDGKYDEAVTMYRRALAELAKQEPRNASNEITFRDRLASCLNMMGKNVEAEAESRAAVALADKLFTPNNHDRAIAHAGLAQVLQSAGKLDEALREAKLAAETIANVSGERNARYGDALMLVGMIENDLEHHAKAAADLSRACEIAAFEVGERSAKVAECRQHHAIALSGLGKNAEAAALVEKAMPIFIEVFGDVHPHVANAYVTRGALYAELGDMKKAIPDLEKAVEQFTKLGDAMDIGHLAGAKWALGQAVYTIDRKRGRDLVQQGLEHFGRAAATWQVAAADARAWLATHR